MPGFERGMSIHLYGIGSTGGHRRAKAVGVDVKEEDRPESKGFTSYRHRRHRFEDRGVDQVQDSEDRAHGWARTRIVGAMRNVCQQLGNGIQLRGFTTPGGPTTSTRKPELRRAKKRKNIVKYNEEEQDEGDDTEPKQLDIKLRKVESKVKFQKELLRPHRRPTDVVFKSFHESEIPAHMPQLVDLPSEYTPKFSISEEPRPLSRHAASTKLQTRFTSSNSSPQQTIDVGSTSRTVTRIVINPLLQKRLGI